MDSTSKVAGASPAGTNNNMISDKSKIVDDV